MLNRSARCKLNVDQTDGRQQFRQVVISITFTASAAGTSMKGLPPDGFDGRYRRVTEMVWIDCIIFDSPLRNNRTTGICSHFGRADRLLSGQ